MNLKLKNLPARWVASRLTYLLLASLMVVALVTGCGNSNSDFVASNSASNSHTTIAPGSPGGPQLSGNLSTVQIRSVLAREIPTQVTDFRVIGRNADGFVIFGPQIVPKAAVVTLQVPIEVTRLDVELLDANGDAVGLFRETLILSAGLTTTINDPEFIAISGPAGPTGPAGVTGMTGPIGPAGPTGATCRRQLYLAA